MSVPPHRTENLILPFDMLCLEGGVVWCICLCVTCQNSLEFNKFAKKKRKEIKRKEKKNEVAKR